MSDVELRSVYDCHMTVNILGVRCSHYTIKGKTGIVKVLNGEDIGTPSPSRLTIQVPTSPGFTSTNAFPSRALDEAAEADLGEGGKGNGNGDVGAAGSGFGGVEGAMVGINSVHVALSSVAAIQVSDSALSLAVPLLFLRVN